MGLRAPGIAQRRVVASALDDILVVGDGAAMADEREFQRDHSLWSDV
jgi:hypothetical protein